MKLIIITMAVMFLTGVASSKTLEEVMKEASVILDADLSEITIEAVPHLGGNAIGVACGPDLILVDKMYWDWANDTQQLLLVVHEVLHTFGVLHSEDMAGFYFKGNYLFVPRSVMYPSTTIFADSLLQITLRHYMMEAKHALPTGDRRRFMMPWIFTYNKKKCLEYLNSGSSHILDIQ